MKKFEEFIGEGKITLKRRYTENHPALTAGTHAKIRNKVLEAIADGTLTQEEFDNILKEMSSDSGRWLRRNSKYFNVAEGGISLSKFGRRILNNINVSEEVKEDEVEEGNAFGDAVRKAKENGDKEFEFDGETYPVKEGRKFVAAAKKAKEEGKKEFEFEGKTYPVLIKENEEVVNEGISPKIKKAIKAVEKGETVYGENIRFPGRFKILSFNKAGNMATVDYEDGTEPMEMASMNIAIDKLQFESAETVNEGVHPKLKKAQKAIKNGETVYGENVRFPGRFKIIELGDLFATVDYEDGTEPMEMASMNIRIDSLQFESVSFVHESFSSFVENLNEAFGSMKLSKLFTNTRGKVDKALSGAFYGKTKVALDKVQDEDLIDTDPMTAYKAKQTNTIVFYISDNEKDNPYAPNDGYGSNKVIPGGGYLLAVASGGNEFYTNTWTSRYSSRDRDRTLKTTPNNSSDTIGISKKYKGWGGTGLYNVKRIAEVSDRAVVINIDLLQQKYSTENKRSERSSAKSGAIAFKSDKDFKQENKNRYMQILATKAAALPLDKMVSDAIDELAKQIQDGLKAGQTTEYGEIYIGKNKRGSTVKLKDASSHMSSILDDYSRYCDYVARSEESEKKYGSGERWYEREAKNYAKSIKDRINKIKTFDYAW